MENSSRWSVVFDLLGDGNLSGGKNATPLKVKGFYTKLLIARSMFAFAKNLYLSASSSIDKNVYYLMDSTDLIGAQASRLQRARERETLGYPGRQPGRLRFSRRWRLTIFQPKGIMALRPLGRSFQ
jgi:hypothetical protein